MNNDTRRREEAKEIIETDHGPDSRIRKKENEIDTE